MKASESAANGYRSMLGLFCLSAPLVLGSSNIDLAHASDNVALYPRHAIGVSYRFGAVIKSPLDGSIIAHYYVKWSAERDGIMAKGSPDLKLSGPRSKIGCASLPMFDRCLIRPM